MLFNGLAQTSKPDLKPVNSSNCLILGRLTLKKRWGVFKVRPKFQEETNEYSNLCSRHWANGVGSKQLY